jgi:hypothetical protein
MSAGGRRRRRGGRKSASLAGDPLDLFLDAITNALGVIMFILLMVVLFGRSSDAPADATAPNASEVREARELEEKRRELQAKLDAMPPAGDPELNARWNAANKAFQKLEDEQTELLSETSRREADIVVAASSLADVRKVLEKLTIEATTQSVSTTAPSGFVRVSRFQQDQRKSVILLISGGKLSRFRATSETKEISAPASGFAITNPATAAEAVGRALDGFQPATYRVELLVWEGSFAQGKMVEQALLDLGFDSNPLPVRAGTSVQSGTGGVQ